MKTRTPMKYDTEKLAALNKQNAEDRVMRTASLRDSRPKLTAEDVVEYLDWLTSNLDAMTPDHRAAHMQAAELAIRTRATDAQGKATTATLIDDGTLPASQ